MEFLKELLKVGVALDGWGTAALAFFLRVVGRGRPARDKLAGADKGPLAPRSTLELFPDVPTAAQLAAPRARVHDPNTLILAWNRMDEAQREVAERSYGGLVLASSHCILRSIRPSTTALGQVVELEVAQAPRGARLVLLTRDIGAEYDGLAQRPRGSAVRVETAIVDFIGTVEGLPLAIVLRPGADLRFG